MLYGATGAGAVPGPLGGLGPAWAQSAELCEASMNDFMVLTSGRPPSSMAPTAMVSSVVADLEAARASWALLYALRALVTAVVRDVIAAAVVPNAVGVAAQEG